MSGKRQKVRHVRDEKEADAIIKSSPSPFVFNDTEWRTPEGAFLFKTFSAGNGQIWKERKHDGIPGKF